MRELLREVTRAAHRALEAKSAVVEPEHLLDEAGAAMSPAAAGATAAPRAGLARWSDDEIRRALGDNGGNVRATARALDVHRNQLRRWLEKHAPPVPRKPTARRCPRALKTREPPTTES